MELFDSERGVYKQGFHSEYFEQLAEVEDYERGRLAAYRVRVVDARYYLGVRDGLPTVFLDLYFKSLIQQPMTAERLFNYNNM